MASTDTARRLTEAHRVDQAAIGADVVRQLEGLWQLLDPKSMNATMPVWLRAVLHTVSATYPASASLAADYLGAFRALELPDVEPIGISPAPFDSRLVVGEFIKEGPKHLMDRLRLGVPLAEASNAAMVLSTGAGVKLALAGGRNTIMGSINSDPLALGYQRVTKGKACAFCAMLASRGPVYRSESSGGFEPHLACRCQPEAVYRRDTALPPESARYGELWRDSTRGYSGKDALNAFRRALAA